MSRERSLSMGCASQGKIKPSRVRQVACGETDGSCRVITVIVVGVKIFGFKKRM